MAVNKTGKDNIRRKKGENDKTFSIERIMLYLEQRKRNTFGKRYWGKMKEILRR